MNKPLNKQMGRDWNRRGRILMPLLNILLLSPLAGLAIVLTLWLCSPNPDTDALFYTGVLLSFDLLLSLLVLLPLRMQGGRQLRHIRALFQAMDKAQQEQFRTEAATYALGTGFYCGQLGLWLHATPCTQLIPYADIVWAYQKKQWLAPYPPGAAAGYSPLREAILVVVTRDNKRFRLGLPTGHTAKPYLGKLQAFAPHAALGLSNSRQKLAKRDFTAFCQTQQGWPGQPE